MTCKGVYRYICENLDADINSPKCRAIKKHLDACPDCSAYLDSLKKTILLYRKEPAPMVSVVHHKRLVKAINIAMLDSNADVRRRKLRTTLAKR